MIGKRLGWTVLVLAAVGIGVPSHAWSQASAPKAQMAADARAYKAAQAQVDPAARLAAFEAFVKEYPKSPMVGRAQGRILSVLLKSFPERTDAIAKQAKQMVKAADKSQRGAEQSNVAMQLADAGTNGVDLPLAEKWAKDSLKKMNEPAFDEAQRAVYAKYKIPAPKAEVLHKDYGAARATALDALADVDVHEGKDDEAAALLTEAARLDPNAEETSELQGQIAYDKHDSATALKDWERAQVEEGTLDKRRRAEMRELYAAAHGGDAAGLDAELDAEYRALFPLPFTPDKPGDVTGGHTVLLELFTGSGCPPCVGGDMAVDGLMEAYPKSELVALSMDLHIPEPDPLANADTVGEADVYGVAHTPSYVMDGGQLEIYGGGREDGKELYGDLTKVLDKDVKVAPAVDLALTAQMGADGKVTAQAVLSAKDEKAVEAQIAGETQALKPEPKPVEKTDTNAGAKAGGKAGDKTGAKADPKTGAAKAAAASVAVPTPDAPKLPKLQLEFALVEDEVRYSGENGVRFHRMVVRALSPQPAMVKDAAAMAGGASAGPIAVLPGATATVPVTFDPKAISTRLKAYLAEYATHNDRFGPIEFLSTDTTMDPKHLGVAAWVEDAATHHVLQAAYVPLTVADAKEEAAR